MAQDRRSWFPPHSRQQDPNLTSKTCGADMFSTYGFYSVYTQKCQSQADDSHGCWVNGASSSFSQQHFLPHLKPSIKQMPLAAILSNQIDGVISKAEGECTQKRFLVFDHSGDRTTMILGSGIEESESLKQPVSPHMKEVLPKGNKDLVVCQRMTTNSEPDLQSEMHEDTDELNALLDDESDYSDEDDEVTSSGHSPSTVSVHGGQETSVENSEEIPIFCRQSYDKKRKVLRSSDYGYDLVTAPLVKTSNDAESSCGSCGNTRTRFQKRFKSSNQIGEEKISETVSLLQSIVPGGKLGDPISVIDRAIDYLKSLKMEAERRGYEAICLHDSEERKKEVTKWACFESKL